MLSENGKMLAKAKAAYCLLKVAAPELLDVDLPEVLNKSERKQ